MQIIGDSLNFRDLFELGLVSLLILTWIIRLSSHKCNGAQFSPP